MVWQEAGNRAGLKRVCGVESRAPRYTLMYQIWMRPGLEAHLNNVWRQQEEELKEIGVVDSWVSIYEEGRCEAFLVWQTRSHWEEASSFLNLFEEICQQLGLAILGWYSPVVVVE
ncbi:MAG: hypothetical protein V7718_07050 [Porticoccus sp.]